MIFKFKVTVNLPEAASNQSIMQMYLNYREDFHGIKELSVENLLNMQSKAPIILVDVRTDAERAISIIPGAISENEFNQKKENFKGIPIVAYCTIGYRSGLFAKKIMQEGFLSYNLIGGVLAWAEAGQSFQNNHGKTNLVHVYAEEWNILPIGYKAVW